MVRTGAIYRIEDDSKNLSSCINRCRFGGGLFFHVCVLMFLQLVGPLIRKSLQDWVLWIHLVSNAAKDKCIPKVNRKAVSKAKQHNYLPLDDKTREKIRQKHRCWQRYMDTRNNKKYLEFKKVRNQVKSLVKKVKHNMEKDIAKMPRPTPRNSGNMPTPKENPKVELQN